MNPERWHQIEKICEAALKLNAGGRAAFLKEACGKDEGLRREVESLLAHEPAAQSFIEVPAMEVAAKVLAEDRSPSLLGQQIDSYQILSLLGAGGMGAVYRAHDRRLERDVAIKALPSAFAADADRLRRFEQEARAAGQLNHPNILAIYDVGTHQGVPYIVCERLEGETLRDRLKGTALPQHKALEVAVQIARGLAAAHQKGIVHRDLKPENLFLTQDGRLKILDFGLAKLTRAQGVGSETDSTHTLATGTLPGQVLGTVGYMAPEQVRGEAVDHRADLFNFGAILYEMLSGQRAFRRNSDVETVHAIVKEEPSGLADLNPPIPTALQRIVRHCLEKSPQERYQSASDIAFDLEMLADPALAALVPQAERAKKRDHLGWIAAAVLALILIALAIAHFRRTPTDGQAAYFSILPPEKTTFTMGQAPAISPDGRRLAFVTNTSSRRSQLYVRALDSPTAQALAGTEGASHAFWSPDNRFIGYFAQGKLKKIPVGGGPPQTLCDVERGFGGSWNRDGVILFNPLYGLYRVSQDGGPVTPVATKVDGARQESAVEAARLWTQFLPDGRHFLFGILSPRPEIRGTYVGSLDSQATRRLLNTVSNVAYAPPGYLLFVRDWTLMAQPFDAELLQLAGEPLQVADQLTFSTHTLQGAFSVSDTGVLAYIRGGNMRQLVWFNRAGQELGPVGAPDAYGLPSLSPDEKSVAVTNSNPAIGASDIWRLDLLRGIASRFTFHPESDRMPIWSPDGGSIVFTSWRDGTWDLYQKAASGTGQEEVLLKSNESKWPTHWSWDGRFIAYNNATAKGDYDLWVLPLFGDHQPIALVQKQFNESGGQFSPSGRWLAHTSDESGKVEVYVRPFPPSAGIWRVSTDGGTQPRWRHDGKELFYLAPDGKLMAVEVTEGERFEAGTPTALFQMRLAMDWDFNHYSVAGDGQRFLITTPVGEAVSPAITVVLNWPAVVKKRPLQ
jgi:Tol biopolymer transport system component